MSRWFRSYGYADVADNLFVGAYPLDGDDVAAVGRVRVQRVMNLVRDEEYPAGARSAVRAAYVEHGIEERRLRFADHGRLPLVELEAAIRHVTGWLEEGYATYVHCRAGRERSAAVAAGVIAVRDGVDVDTALAQLRRRKPSAEPLRDQREDLQAWWEARARLGPFGILDARAGSERRGGDRRRSERRGDAEPNPPPAAFSP